MAKANPLAVEREPTWSKPYTFTDGKEVKFEVTLRRISDPAYIRFDEEAAGKVARYVTGIGERGTKHFKEPEMLMGAGERPCESNHSYWLAACALSGSQVTESADDWYSPEEWIMFMQNPEIALQASEAFAELSTEGESVKEGESSTPSQ